MPESQDNIRQVLKLLNAGRFSEADQLGRRLLNQHGQDSTLLNLLATAASERRRYEDACYYLEKSIQTAPDEYAAHFNLGMARRALGLFYPAETAFEEVIRLKPDHGDAYFQLADLYAANDDLTRAFAYYSQAADLDPKSAAALNNLGNIQIRWGDAIQAMGYYLKALKADAGYAKAYYNLAAVLYERLNRTDEAEECLQQALKINPDDGKAYNLLGIIALNERDDLDQAHHCFRQAINVSPNLAVASHNLANLLAGRSGELETALLHAQKAGELNPQAVNSCVLTLDLMTRVCFWSNLDLLKERLTQLTVKDSAQHIHENPFVGLRLYDDPERHFRTACVHGNQMARKALEGNHSFPAVIRTERKKIVLGYQSSDFHDHPVGRLIQNLFAVHDRHDFQVNAYSAGKNDDSSVLETIKQGVDVFVNARGMTPANLAGRIYDDQVDILIDLTGYTRQSLLPVCALRPAPIQVSYLGFLGTTGTEFMDYIITDSYVTPPWAEKYYTEKFVYLPHSYQINAFPEEIDSRRISRSREGLPENAFVFCSFNHALKIDPAIFGVWMNILKRIQNSVLWLIAGNQWVKKNLNTEAGSHGVNPECLIWAERVPFNMHQNRLKLADLALDTLTYNGGATTSMALSAGLPVLTIPGKSFTSRMSASALQTVGLDDFIARDLSEYEQKAVEKASNPHEFAALRNKLSQTIRKTPLFNVDLFTRNLEKAFKEMRRIHLAGNKPEKIVI